MYFKPKKRTTIIYYYKPLLSRKRVGYWRKKATKKKVFMNAYRSNTRLKKLNLIYQE
jgi:hypothetical protein